jgi:hypothetical protein
MESFPDHRELEAVYLSQIVSATVPSWGTDGFWCIQTYPCLMFMVSAHLGRAYNPCLGWTYSVASQDRENMTMLVSATSPHFQV